MTKRNKVGLIVHPKGVEQITDYIGRQRAMQNLGEKKFNEKLIAQLMRWCPAVKMIDFSMTSHADRQNTIDGFCMNAAFLPEMIFTNYPLVLEKIEDALRASEKAGACVASLGAFTSIADGRQGENVSKVVTSMAVTNGSTYTSAMVIETIRKMCVTLGIDIGRANLAVIGATGSIGRTVSRYFMGKTGKLTLTGRKKEKLDRYLGQYQDIYDNLVLAVDNNLAVADADLVVSVTNSIESIFKADAFKSGAVICDVGFPKNIAAACSHRDDILVLSGGLAKLPDHIENLDVMGLPTTNICYGCLSEGILLGLEGRPDLCTVGLDDIPLENVDLLIEKGYEHGFDIAPFHNDYKYYSDEDYDRIKNILEMPERESVQGGVC
ncbi:MAG: hypothetical protein SWH61_11760 [Thermodesulfobacteriota bacterium]|nr:hypothetical protein [Thermodesulfobacteriota bacterium]